MCKEGEKSKNCDVIFIFAFGSPKELASNQILAQRGIDLYQSYDKQVPIVTQKDIPLSSESNHHLYFLDSDIKGYCCTLKLIKIFSSLAKSNDWKKVLVVAAPMHIKRCVRDLMKLGFEICEDTYILNIKSINANKKYKFYSINSAQIWTRDPLFFWFREIPLRLLPWKIYEWISDRF